MQALGQSEALRDALAQTYAAHVHNAVQDVFVSDLIREIDVLVLDSNPSSASVASAMATLRDEAVLTELQADYRVIVPVRGYNERELDEAMSNLVHEMHEESELKAQHGGIPKATSADRKY